MKASSDHLIRLIDDILDLARVESGRMILDRETIAARGVHLGRDRSGRAASQIGRGGPHDGVPPMRAASMSATKIGSVRSW
jgi:hypothetical protein